MCRKIGPNRAMTFGTINAICSTIARLSILTQELPMLAYGFIRRALVGTSLLVALASPTAAAPIFSDDFSADALALNADPLQWTVTDGTVDVVGTGSFAFLCAGGPSPSRCVDLDGSTGNAGTMTSDSFVLAPGDYELSFWLAGNQRGGAADSVTVSVQLPSLYTESFILTSGAAWTQFVRTFSYADAAAPFSIVFNHAGGDNVGIVLDNVSLDPVAVPEPGTLTLLGTGALMVARRLRRRGVKA